MISLHKNMLRFLTITAKKLKKKPTNFLIASMLVFFYTSIEAIKKFVFFF